MNNSRAVAIIGMSCSFPGSPNIESFWETIRDGRVHFRDVPPERWNHSAFYSPNPRTPEMTYARKIACLDDVRSFSPERYSMPPRRAYPMDPQQRLMLDQARLALDDAGYGGRPMPRSTGVYIGASVSEYKDLVVSRLRSRQILGGQWGELPQLPDSAAKDAVSDVAAIQQYSMVGVLLNMIACSISEAFDLQGPALVMDAACSSALLAVHEAVLHLREHICDAAIVGGVYSICTPDMMVGFSRIGALSRSDVCRPFDSRADGFVLGEGAGAVVLKRLDDAVRDGDRVWAIIRGVGLNNDGRGEGPMTPRLGGQVDALGRAYRDAAVSPTTVSYVEAHGTATPVGDLTEISAIKEHARVNDDRTISCGIGSVKGNIGHTLAAAGMAGLIKSVLVLNKKIIPPQAGWHSPPGGFDLECGGFFIPTSPQPFQSKPDSPRRVGVNAFGFGGTNVHVVLEESPAIDSHHVSIHGLKNHDSQLFMVSAPRPSLLVEHLHAIARAIDQSGASLPDLAYTLTVTRRREEARLAFVATSNADLKSKLQKAIGAVDGQVFEDIVYSPKPEPPAQRNVAFLFPGSDTWAPEFCGALYRQFPSFQSQLDALANSLNGSLDKPLASYLSPHANGSGRNADSSNGHRHEPVLATAMQLALTGFVAELGLRPYAAIGDGWGELAAAAAGGVISSQEALHLVAGSNGCSSQITSSSAAGNGHAGQDRIRISPARIPLISSLVSEADFAGRAENSLKFAQHTTTRREFADALRQLQAVGANVLLQVGGSGQFLQPALAKLNGDAESIRIVGLTSYDNDPHSGFLYALGKLAVMGVPLDLSSLYLGARPVSLPSAPLQTRPFWVVDDSKRSQNLNSHSAVIADESPAIFPETLNDAEEARLDPEPATAGQVQLPLSRSAVASTAVVEQTSDEIRQRVLELIAQVSAYPIEDLKLEQKLGIDLGFDSLMGVDLYVALKDHFTQAAEIPQTLIGGETTIAELIHAVAAAITAPGAAEEARKTADISRYVVMPVERPLALRPQHSGLPFSGRILLVTDTLGVAALLMNRLIEAGQEVELISPNDDLHIEGETAVIDLSRVTSSVSYTDPASLRAPMLSLLRRASEATAHRVVPAAFVTVHTAIDNAGLAGAIKAIAREWPKALVRSIEIGNDKPAPWMAETIFNELAGSDQSVEVSYLSGHRRVSRCVSAPIDTRALETATVVAISGGGKGLGAMLAIELARRYQARLLLLGRSENAVSTVQSVREAGGNALYLQCDVRDAVQVKAAFEQCRERFGPIEHVVHAAGILADQAIASKNLNLAADVFDTKVAGALVLWNAARLDSLRSFVMYGSWAGRFGNAHQADYSAANHLLGRLASVFGEERPETHVSAVDLPPWEGSSMVSAMPDAARKALSGRVPFLTNEIGLDHILAEMAADGTSGEVILGADLEDDPVDDHVVIRVSTAEFPWLEDHRIEGQVVIPFAFLLDQAVAAARRLGLGPLLTLSDSAILSVPAVPDAGHVQMEITARGTRQAAEVQIDLITEGARQPVLRLRAASAPQPLSSLVQPGNGRIPELSMAEFYRQHTFHGPRLRALASVSEIGLTHATAILADKVDNSVLGEAIDILSLDATLQLCAFWASANIGRIGLPIGADEVRVLASEKWNGATNIVGILEGSSGEVLTANLDLLDSQRKPIIQIRGMRCRLLSQPLSAAHPKEKVGPVRIDDVDSSSWRIAEFPEVKALRQRFEMARKSGLADPYFSVHERVTNDTSVIGGHEYINFASYNYLGLSGDPDVNAAAADAVERYGTSVSASRLASGEKPLHRELEREIADFLGCEDSIVMVGGHATNVSVIGCLFGPQDLVVHDSLAHDSILAGIKLAGAKRRPFPHNDASALDQILRQSRSSARRVLIAIEGVYSMDGDIPPLPQIVEIKRRHRALLLVDEAHSLGVLGKTGRGVGEHFGVHRQDVDLWMGTLSKSLASCGGYIAGLSELVRYLKYSNPGFVYSVGISPANAAASLAALRKICAHPELVALLRDRSRMFLELSRERGINTGLSEGTAVVPCIVGSSVNCLRLARVLGERRINVQPILYPAVEETLTRLRFFLTARHSEQQIRDTVSAVAEELQKIDPNCLSRSRMVRNAASYGGLTDAAVS